MHTLQIYRSTCFKDGLQSKKSHLKQNTRTQPLSINIKKSKIKNQKSNQLLDNTWLYLSLLSFFFPFLRHRIPLCCFPPHKFRVFCVIGMVLSMDLECSPRSSEALGTESRSPCGEQLATGGCGSTSSQAWGGVPRWFLSSSWPYPFWNRIVFV